MDCGITARSKWYYYVYRAYADPCKIICNALYYRVRKGGTRCLIRTRTDSVVAKRNEKKGTPYPDG